jgi:hypothetical protein
MLSLVTSAATSTKDLSHLIMKSSPSRRSKYAVLIPLLVLAAHAAESRTILLIFVLPFSGVEELDELDEFEDG